MKTWSMMLPYIKVIQRPVMNNKDNKIAAQMILKELIVDNYMPRRIDHEDT